MGGGHRAGPSGHLAATQPSWPDQALRLATWARLLSLAGLRLPPSPLLSAWLQMPSVIGHSVDAAGPRAWPEGLCPMSLAAEWA